MLQEPGAETEPGCPPQRYGFLGVSADTLGSQALKPACHIGGGRAESSPASGTGTANVSRISSEEDPCSDS